MQDDIWDVAYGTICFVENRLHDHSKVDQFVRTKDILFRIERMNGETIYMLLLNAYCLGVATIHQAKAKFPEADYIVLSGDWCEYTKEAKQYGKDNGLGIFTISEFMGALHRKNPKTYI
ncbi:MAG: hypothetical protein MPK62_04735 [Alphaproteobacteria bacterium]|nr:hypothetical protein [Alphaproteobacteria bacterium]MDA8030431.1 hypothetical protein [Alphaproteobacteria bacterium]